MSTPTPTLPAPRESALAGRTIVLIGGSSGIGLETARQARSHGGEVILVGRDVRRLERAALEVGARYTAPFDANDLVALREFFDTAPGPIDHVLVTAGQPGYGALLDMEAEEIRDGASKRVTVSVEVARHAAPRMRPSGTIIFIGGTGARRVKPGLGLAPVVTAAMPPLVAMLALEIAPIRVNLIAPGFVDTPLSASLLGDAIEARRQELRSSLPIGRVVTAGDVAALAIQLMVNTALTGATYDIDGGQQFL